MRPSTVTLTLTALSCWLGVVSTTTGCSMLRKKNKTRHRAAPVGEPIGERVNTPKLDLPATQRFPIKIRGSSWTSLSDFTKDDLKGHFHLSGDRLGATLSIKREKVKDQAQKRRSRSTFEVELKSQFDLTVLAANEDILLEIRGEANADGLRSVHPSDAESGMQAWLDDVQATADRNALVNLLEKLETERARLNSLAGGAPAAADAGETPASPAVAKEPATPAAKAEPKPAPKPEPALPEDPESRELYENGLISKEEYMEARRKKAGR